MDKARGIQRYVHEYDESLWDEEDRIELPQCLDDLDDLEYAAADLLKGLNIKLPCSQYVEVVSTPTDLYTPCFALFSNYDIEKNMPSEEEIMTVQKELKLKGKPAWWPSFAFSWLSSF